MNFKVKCTRVKENVAPRFTVGKVYEVRNGKLFADKSCRFESWGRPHNGNGDFEALRKWFKDYYEFELVEEHKTKYKAGDKVRVRSDLTNNLHLYKMENPRNNGWCVVPDMVDLAGKVVTITEYSALNDGYRVAETKSLVWTDEMFEGLASDYKIGDRVVIEESNIEGMCHYRGRDLIGTIIDVNYTTQTNYPYKVVSSENEFGIWCKVKCLATENKPENKPENKKVEDNKMDATKVMNGNVRCVGYKKNEKNFTIGKVYKVKDGRITCDNGFTYNPLTCTTAVEWLLPWYTFEVADEKIVITHDGKTTTATMYCDDGTKKVATARCAPEDTFDFNVGAKLAMDRLMEYVENSKYTVVEVRFDRSNRTYHYKTKDCAAKVGMEIIVPVGAGNRKIECEITNVISGDHYIGTFPMSDMKEIQIEEVKLYNGKVVCIDSGNCSETMTVGKIYHIVDGVGYADDGSLLTTKPVKSVDHLNSRFITLKFLEIVE